MEMKPVYEWDEVKRRSNRTKHGVDFTEMEAFEWDTAIVEPDDYEGEYRWIAKGFIGAVLHLVVYDRTREQNAHHQLAQSEAQREEELCGKPPVKSILKT